MGVGVVAEDRGPAAGGVPRLSGAEFRRRRRGRNYAMLFALLALIALFYAISIVQMSR